MRLLRLTLALLILFSMIAPATALADPATAPQAVRSFDFEGADPTGGMQIDPLAVPQTAWWGRITSRAHGGTYGLWCAGVQDGVATLSPDPFLYPTATFGAARIDMTETAELYSSTADFWYTMPSLGSDDALSGSLILAWAGQGTSTPSRSDWPLTGDGVWSHSSVPLESYLSRRPGYVTFRFHDYITDAQVGQGATIDDVVISGYRFGPVRSLATTQSGASTLLTWNAPPRALDDSSDETRAVGYRVWRSPGAGAPYSWTELTGARLSGRSFADSSAAVGGTDTYAVQAWDPGTGVGYGEMTTRTASITDPLTFDKSVSTGTVAANGTVTYSYAVTNSSAGTFTVGIADDKLGSILSGFQLAPRSSRTTTKAAQLTTTTTNVATLTALDGYGRTRTKTASAYVRVVGASIWVTVTPDTTRAVAGQSVSYAYTVRNAGDTTLTAVGIADSLNGQVLSGRTLAPGAQVTTSAASALTTTTTNVATATGTVFGLGTSVTASGQATVAVRSPSLTLAKSASASPVTPGTSVTYTYLVTNTGDETLLGGAVADDKLGPVGSFAALAPGDAQTFYAAGALFQDTTNLATATASYGTSGTAFHGARNASDSEFVDVVTPSVAITKTVDKPVVLAGTRVVYSYRVANNGDSDLKGVNITDDHLGHIAGPFGLTVGQSATYTAQATITVDTSNVATVSGSALATMVSDTDAVSVDVIAPHVSLSRSVSATLAAGGASLTHTFTVANDGDVALNGVRLVDDRLGIVLGPVSLAPGEQAQQVRTAAIADDTTFTASVTATDALIGTAVGATRTVSVEVIHPAMTLSKSVNPASVTSGESVTYTFTLTNSGDTPLAAISLTDDVLGAVTSGIALGSGESTQLARVRTPSASESGAAHASGHATLLPAATVGADSAVVGVTVSSPPSPPPAPTPDPAPAPAPVTPALPGHTLYTPVAPSTVYYGRTFTMYGFLKPRHTAGAYSVKLEGYRYERQSNGTYKWVRRATWYAKNANYSTYTKYIKYGNLKLRGKWKFRAVHTHTGYLPKYSGYRYLTVK